MINFKDISKTFKSDIFNQPFTALSNVTFSVPEGSMVGFLGANGAGKTTSLKIMMDFIRPDSGDVVFSKKLGNNRMEIFKKIGFLPERPYFYPTLKGSEFLRFMGSLSGLNIGLINHEIEKWAPKFKIDHALEREIKTYSKGMLQRIGFLSTILHHPDLVILDEPLSGLDPVGRKELKDVIVDVHNEGKTVFFSSHIVSDIEEICDRVVFLKEGKLAYDGSVSTLISNNLTNDFYVIAKVSDDFVASDLVLNEVNLPDNLKKYLVSSNLKDKFLAELISTNQNIINVEMKKLSLEEIFYRTRGDS